MEYIDILDEKGNLTGKVKPKSEIHRGGDWHKAVHVWLLNSKGELLIQLRSKNKESHPNCWDISAAGHVSAGEDSLTSALRETEEEIGIKFKPEQLTLIGQIVQQSVQNNGTYINNEHNDVYVVRADIEASQIKMPDGEVQEVKWIPWQELQQWFKEKKADLVLHPEEFSLLFKYLGNKD